MMSGCWQFTTLAAAEDEHNMTLFLQEEVPSVFGYHPKRPIDRSSQRHDMRLQASISAS